MIRRVYARDPIREALCEFKFRVPSQGWAVLPGQLFERVQGVFPAEPQLDGFGRGIQFKQPGGVAAEIILGNSPQGVRLQTEDGTQLVRIVPGAISVHMLPPYPHWPAFHDALRSVLEAMADVTKGEMDVERVGMRYINQVTALPDDAKVSDYFIVRPPSSSLASTLL